MNRRRRSVPRPAADFIPAARLPTTLFAPSSKAEAGLHDENISFADVEEYIGADLAGNAWVPGAADPTAGTGTLSFQTGFFSPDLPSPPVLAGVT